MYACVLLLRLSIISSNCELNKTIFFCYFAPFTTHDHLTEKVQLQYTTQHKITAVDGPCGELQNHRLQSIFTKSWMKQSFHLTFRTRKKKMYVMTCPAAPIEVQSSDFLEQGLCKEVEACRFGALATQLRPQRNYITDQNSYPMISLNLACLHSSRSASASFNMCLYSWSMVWEQIFFASHLHGANVTSLDRLTEEQRIERWTQEVMLSRARVLNDRTTKACMCVLLWIACWKDTCGQKYTKV